MDCWLRDLFSRKVLNRDDLDNYLVQREIDVSFFMASQLTGQWCNVLRFLLTDIRPRLKLCFPRMK